MPNIGQRFVRWCLAVILLATWLPAAATAQEKPAVSLDQAIRTVKDNFAIPGEYTKFSSGFSSGLGADRDRQEWSLNWEAPAEPGAGFHAQVDAVTGEIRSISHWKPGKPGQPVPRVPAVSEEQAQKIAGEFLNRLAAKHIQELQPVPTQDQVIPLGNYGPVSYHFRWQRLVNGIPFPTDGVNMEISGEDGRLVSYNLEWTSADFPAARGTIPLEKAREAFDGAGMLELQYFQPFRRSPMEAGKKPEILLVYRLNHPSGGVIDAFTGRPLVPEDGRYLVEKSIPGGGGGEESFMRMNDGQPAVSVPLTPAEQQEIERTAKLIARDQAVEAVKKWVQVPDNLALRGANLATNWQNPDTHIWNLNWSDEKAGDEKPGYMFARVNAFTGELVGFDLYYPGTDGKTGTMDRPAAQKIAEEFLQRIQPGRFQEVKLDESQPLVTREKGKNPPFQYFNYRRLVNGIPFPGNGLNVRVDTVQGKVVSYNLNWSDRQFPSATGVLNAKQAGESFLKYRPLTLSYARMYGPDGPGDIRLVYQPLATGWGVPTIDMVDARSGAGLDWEGKPVSQNPRAYQFNDIAGNFAEREISLLGRAGIFGEYGDAFHPDENITTISLLRAMLMVKFGAQGFSGLSDEEVLKRVREQGWLTESTQPGAPVDRLTLAKLLIRFLGLDRAARVEGIYQVPYADAGSLPAGSLGYAALTWGLGIIKGDGQAFVPDHQVTRAEAAAALVRTLEVKP